MYSLKSILAIAISLSSLRFLELSTTILYSSIQFFSLNLSFLFLWAPLCREFSLFLEKARKNSLAIFLIALACLVIDIAMFFAIVIQSFENYMFGYSAELNVFVILGLVIMYSFGSWLALCGLEYRKLRNLIPLGTEQISNHVTQILAEKV